MDEHKSKCNCNHYDSGYLYVPMVSYPSATNNNFLSELKPTSCMQVMLWIPMMVVLLFVVVGVFALGIYDWFGNYND